MESPTGGISVKTYVILEPSHAICNGNYMSFEKQLLARVVGLGRDEAPACGTLREEVARTACHELDPVKPINS